MNLPFADVGTSLFNMIQQELPAPAMLGAANAGAKRQLFADKLDKTLQAGKPAAAQAMADAPAENGPPAADLSDPVSRMLSEQLSDKQGHQFISALQSILLMLSKGKLDAVSVDSGGLDVLKKMLVNAGFDESEVNSLIEELTALLDEGELGMDKVFDKLFDLSFDAADADRQELFVNPEDVNFLESIFISLGIPAEDIRQLLSSAQSGDQGINLDTLIENLKQYQKNAFSNNQTYQVPTDQTPISLLSQSLGLKLEPAQPDMFSLNDIVKALENLRTEKNNLTVRTQGGSPQQQAVAEKPADLLNTLFKALNIEKKEITRPVVEFTAEKIKDAFKNPFAAVEGNTKELHTGFGMDKGRFLKKGDVKEVPKGLETLLDGNVKDPGAAKEKIGAGVETARRFSLTRETKTQIPQAVAGETKSGSTETRFEIPLPKASPKPLPAYLTQQVGKSLIRAINLGENSLKIQLKPPELGRLLMTIDNTGNNMRVSIMTENHAAKEIITQNVTELRSLLSNSGVNLERFEVDMSQDFRQSMADARQQAGQSGKRGAQHRGRGNGNEKADRINETVLEQIGPDADGSVHLVA